MEKLDLVSTWNICQPPPSHLHPHNQFSLAYAVPDIKYVSIVYAISRDGRFLWVIG